MSDFNPREPIRLSDIDNLLEDSIFTSSNGAKLAEYLRKKRGTGGRVRLQNIFEKVAATIPKPIFNFDIDSSQLNPVPDSPQQLPDAVIDDVAESAASTPIASTSTAPVPNTNDVIEVVPDQPGQPGLTPWVVVHDLKVASPKPTTTKSSDPGVSNMGRQALLNQYHRTNMAKCELLRQITSSTPKPEAAASLSRISAFTTSISPITEADTPRVPEADRVAASQAVAPPPLEMPVATPIVLLPASTTAAVIPVDTVLPPQILAPCSQALAETTPRKVIVVSTPAVPVPTSPNMIIPETPSPVKEIAESPKVAHQILPRKLSVTFNNLQDQEANESNLNITSDESEPVLTELLVVKDLVGVEQEQQQPKQQQAVELPELPVIVRQLVHQEYTVERAAEEVVPVNEEMSIEEEQPVMPQQRVENSIITKGILKDSFSSSQKKRHTFRVSFSQQLVQQREISPAPSIPEAHYSSSSDDSSDLSDDEDFDDGDYQVVDEVYSDDGECDPHDIAENYNALVRDDDELEKRLSEIHERIPSPIINVVDEAPVQWYETRTPRSQKEHQDELLAPATCAKDNKTDLQLVDIITDWDDEDDDEDVEKEDQEQSPVKESQPQPPIDIPETQPSTQNTNVTICDAMDISNMEDSAERLIDLPPPPTSFNGSMPVEAIVGTSPERPITPPTQFTDSAKRRFLQANEDALISRIQNELPPPPSQPPLSPPATPERVPDTLIDFVQSFRDQPPPPPVVTAASRKTIIPAKKTRRTAHVVDPATNSYFETVMKPFVHPAAPTVAKQTKDHQLTTAQKRKLYASSNGVVKPVKLNGVVEPSAALRNFKIIVQKLRVDTYPGKLTDADKAAIERAIEAKGLQSNLADAKESAREIAGNRKEPPTKAQPVKAAVEKLGNGDGPSDSFEPAFAGFDEHNDLRRQPELLRRNTGTSAHPKADQAKEQEMENNPETELHHDAPPSEPEVRRTRVLRKKTNAKSAELGNSAEETAPTPVVEKVVDELSNERLNSNDSPDPEVEGRRPARKKKNNPTEEKIVEPTVRETADEPVNERLTAIEEVQDPPPEVANGNGRRTARGNTKHTSSNEQRKDPAEEIDQPTSERSDEHSDERRNPERVEDSQLASIPEVSTTDSVGQNPEKEQMVSRMPLEAAGVRPLETQPKRRGRPKKNNPTVQPAAVQVEPTANSKMVVHQSDETNNPEIEENSQADTQSFEASDASKDVDKDAQSLPFKKRKGRMLSDDEPPALEPFGEATPVDSNDNIPPVLAHNDPVPSTSSRQRKGHYHEKHTTEKPEKKLSRFYRDVDDADETWVPNKKSLKDRYNRRMRKKVDTADSPQRPRRTHEEEEPVEEVRRSNRTRRLAEAVVKRNPSLKSIYEKPNYRQLTDEEFVQLTREATKRAGEKKQKAKATPKTTVSSDSTTVATPESRKRLQEDPQEPTTSKRTRPDDDIVMLNSDVQPIVTEPSPTATDSDKTTSAQTMQQYSWMLKLMQTNGVECMGQTNSGLIVGGQYMHYTQEHLSYRERNGIQYSFYLHSETENYGFLRFAPSVVKKLTKTEQYLLKFLILEGNLSIQLNGHKIQVKGGDFLMLPEFSTYAIENGKEVSIIFMIKLCPTLCGA